MISPIITSTRFILFESQTKKFDYLPVVKNSNDSIIRSDKCDVFNGRSKKRFILSDFDPHGTTRNEFREVSHGIEYGLFNKFPIFRENNDSGVDEVSRPVRTSLFVEAEIPVKPAYYVVI